VRRCRGLRPPEGSAAERITAGEAGTTTAWCSAIQTDTSRVGKIKVANLK
jgi:hypothetical protein